MADVDEVDEADVAHVGHVEDDECVVVEQVLATDHRQVGKQRRQRAQPGDSVQQQVVGDLAQTRERQVAEVDLMPATAVRQNDVQMTFDDRAALQSTQS